MADLGTGQPLQVLRDACAALAAEGVTAHFVQVRPAMCALRRCTGWRAACHPQPQLVSQHLL